MDLSKRVQGKEQDVNIKGKFGNPNLSNLSKMPHENEILNPPLLLFNIYPYRVH